MGLGLMRAVRRGGCALAILALGSSTLAAQDAPLTLQQVVARATERYPAIRAAAAQVSAAAASAAVSRDAYLPRADLVWQTNRSTRNNISGLLFPQPVVSGISGPVSPDTNQS